MDFWMFIGAVIAGYVGSIYSWPTVRTWITGEYAEMTEMRRRAMAS